MSVTHSAVIGAGMLGGGAVSLMNEIDEQVAGSIWSQGVIVTTGLAMFVFFDRRERSAIADRNTERRKAAEEKDAKIADLEHRLAAATQALIDELKRRHDGGS